MDDIEKLLFTPAEVAVQLGIGRTRVYALIEDGTIPSIRIGKSLRVPVDRLKQLVENLKKEAERKQERSDGRS